MTEGMPLQAALRLSEDVQVAYPNIAVSVQRRPGKAEYWLLCSYTQRDISDRYNTFQLFAIDHEAEWATWKRNWRQSEMGVL